MREVRSLFNLPSRGSAPKSELVFPASKELQPPSIATPDIFKLDASQDLDALPLPEDVQVRLDRNSVNAENSKVYDRDLDQRDFFATADGFIGMAPATLEIGDEVIVPFGPSRPFVVRSHGDHHVLIGDAVVPGIVSGQMVNLCKEGTMAGRDYLLK
ncbi:hypothetical protein LTR12_014952 [Friedmanniomyces endolithicus]|nr:hypothetical protein LTR74_002435 [Friedmanniomyces endolithicus]KAK1810670.1 hypothetical protein LTR12_014952 [Friedmanniomyces endolithicus]